MAAQGPYLTSEQVAQRLCLSRPTILRMTRAGRIPYAIKLDGPRGAYLYDPQVVQLVAAQRAPQPENGAP